MTALAKDGKFDQMDTPETVSPRIVQYDVEASTTIYGGAIVAKNTSGNMVPVSADTTLIVVGQCDRQVVNSGAAGVQKVLVRRGAFYYNCGTAGDALTKADLFAIVYAIDDNTVGKTNGGATRCKAGILMDVRADGKVAVLLGVMGLGQAFP